MVTVYNKCVLCDLCPEFNQLKATSHCSFCQLDICNLHSKQFSTHNSFLIKQYEISYRKKHIFTLCSNCYKLFQNKIDDILIKEMNLRLKYVDKFADDFQTLKKENDLLWNEFIKTLENDDLSNIPDYLGKD